MKQKIPLCKKDESSFDKMSVRELMKQMENESLDLI